MRKLFFLVLLFLMLSSKMLTAVEDDSFLIRRMYLDVLGRVPTTEEIEWYCVYNKNGYSLAVDWALSISNNKMKHYPKDQAKEILLSEDYKNYKKVPLSKEQLQKNIMFSVGDGDINLTEENYKNSLLKLIRFALASSDSETDAIDYICNKLMARSTNLDEANYLFRHFKDKRKSLSEEESWLSVLDQILLLPDVKMK
jgi:hypothetical protein